MLVKNRIIPMSESLQSCSVDFAAASTNFLQVWLKIFFAILILLENDRMTREIIGLSMAWEQEFDDGEDALVKQIRVDRADKFETCQPTSICALIIHRLIEDSMQSERDVPDIYDQYLNSLVSIRTTRQHRDTPLTVVGSEALLSTRRP
jgi:hypothetical protein